MFPFYCYYEPLHLTSDANMYGYLQGHKHPATGQVPKGEEFSFTIQLPVVPIIEMRFLIPSSILGYLLAGSYASVVPWVPSVMDGCVKQPHQPSFHSFLPYLQL